ncbi:MAG: FAD-binding protein, partial [Spirochaetaceae bacterium]|nr:FAD-binding protein [Spirochaetaceae bacterium]
QFLKALGNSGPFYLIETIPAGTDILGGVKTNYDQQVLRGNGSVIEGLYAVGSMSNRPYYNQYYFSGSALTFAATGGRIAGAHAARK